MPCEPVDRVAAQERMNRLAERVGFEPTCRLPDKTLSRRPRYDHFGTSPVVCGLCSGPAKAGHYVLHLPGG